MEGMVEFKHELEIKLILMLKQCNTACHFSSRFCTKEIRVWSCSNKSSHLKWGNQDH